jgi:hypothetical protein
VGKYQGKTSIVYDQFSSESFSILYVKEKGENARVVLPA